MKSTNSNHSKTTNNTRQIYTKNAISLSGNNFKTMIEGIREVDRKFGNDNAIIKQSSEKSTAKK